MAILRAQVKVGEGGLSPLGALQAPAASVVSHKFVRLIRGGQARRSLNLACRPRVKQDKTLGSIRAQPSEKLHSLSNEIDNYTSNRRQNRGLIPFADCAHRGFGNGHTFADIGQWILFVLFILQRERSVRREGGQL